MKTRNFFFFLLLLFLGRDIYGLNNLTDSNIAAATYYVSTDGNDTNPGTAKLPWKTLAKVNQALNAGDTAIFLDGRYSGRIIPTADGTGDGKAIVYRSANLHGAILVGKPGESRIIDLKNKQYITIDGFKMLPDSGGFGNIEGCSHIVLQNCHMEGSSGVYCALIFMNSNFNRMMNNNLFRVVSRTKDSKIHGDGCQFISSSHNVIQGNTFSKIGHSPLRIWGRPNPELAGYNIIRGNFFNNGWGRNFEFFNLYRSLFEQNIITDAYHGAKSAHPNSKVFFSEGIIRNCLIYDNWDNVLGTGSYRDAGTIPDIPLRLENSRFYNNTIAYNPSWVWKLSSNNIEKAISSNIFQNNIFYRNDPFGDYAALITDSDLQADGNRFYNNLFFGDRAGQAGIRISDVKYTVNDLHKKFPLVCSGNLDANPDFINEEDRYFLPGEGSPAHNAGMYLTVTTRSGKGMVLPVADAVYFFDGFGIEGEKGDLIMIGKEKEIARVVKANLEKNELTLDREVNWLVNATVSLPYSGNAPDLGALQYGKTGVFNVVPQAFPAIALPGEAVAFKSYQNEPTKGVLFKWDFGDGTQSEEEAPVHVYRNKGDHIVRLHCAAPSGETSTRMLIVRVDITKDPKEPLMQTGFEEKEFEEWAIVWHHGTSRTPFTYYPVARENGQGQKMCVSTEANNINLTTRVRLKHWDIDKYPFIRFSYRIPEEVPVGIWLGTWESKKYPNLVCVGGSSTNSNGSLPLVRSIQLIDDGQWHEAELDARVIREIIPDLKVLKMFQFSTFANTHEGQKFWFDDFGIYPVYSQ